MEVAIILLAYVLGIATGAIGIIALTLWLGKRAIDKETKAKLPSKESVSTRLKKVKEITNEQLDLQGAISGPQKNALHGKYKNGLIGRIKELEEQKVEILKSIITDGFDPEITVIDDSGVVTALKLSEFLGQNGITMPSKDSQPDAQTKQVGKFIVHKGGKDDSGTTH